MMAGQAPADRADRADGPDKAPAAPSPRASVWVLWGMGRHLPVPDLPIQLHGGTVAELRRERDRNYRPAVGADGLPLWSELDIYAEGTRPPLGRTLAELTEEEHARLALPARPAVVT